MKDLSWQGVAAFCLMLAIVCAYWAGFEHAGRVQAEHREATLRVDLKLLQQAQADKATADAKTDAEADLFSDAEFKVQR